MLGEPFVVLPMHTWSRVTATGKAIAFPIAQGSKTLSCPAEPWQQEGLCAAACQRRLKEGDVIAGLLGKVSELCSSADLGLASISMGEYVEAPISVMANLKRKSKTDI